MEGLVQRVSGAIEALPAGESVLRLYRREAGVSTKVEDAIAAALAKQGAKATSIEFEAAFNVEFSKKPVDAARVASVICFLVAETFAPLDVALDSCLGPAAIELGPRRTFQTAFSSTACSMCAACGIKSVARLERSRRYVVGVDEGDGASSSSRGALAAALHDRMTECVWDDGSMMKEPSSEPAHGVSSKKKRDNGGGVVTVADLRTANAELSLGFDVFDCDYYAQVFGERLKRDPTHAELYDMSQSNSEHSRHWFFSGRHVIDGVEKAQTLFELVKATLKAAKSDASVIAFHDNSSAIRLGADGGEAWRLVPRTVGEPSAMEFQRQSLLGVLTAETHNFPCAVAPMPGAETGTGGRIRDNQATGRGAHVVAGVAGYCVGNLRMPDHPIAGEDLKAAYPAHLATPLQILVEASDGASDYGNKFGEPVIVGFCRSYGGRVSPEGAPQQVERCEWIKPIMFSAGLGLMHAEHTAKEPAAPGMLVAKIGGPAYPIGMGGGAASSRVATEANVALDFDAVQRGDAQMGNRMNRVIRACCELREANPIASIHDQGCGGNANVLKEIVEGAGAEYRLSKFSLGDATMTGLEIWGAEYQESNGVLLRTEDEPLLRKLCARENCGMDVVGDVETVKTVRVIDDRHDPEIVLSDLPLDLVMEKLPPKTFRSDTPLRVLTPLQRKTDSTTTPPVAFRAALRDVLGLPRVCSKRFLVHKVDRSVGGLVARQQCVGPLQLPLSDCAVIARSPLSREGVAVAVGEAPQLSNLDPERMARCAVAEMLTNLSFAHVSRREDIRLSANWMWAAKLPGEGAKMYAACEAMAAALIQAHVAVDGGKDSLSMAAPDGLGNTVKAPGALTLTAYAPCVDVNATVTPDLKLDDGALIFLDLGAAHDLGGSALAQAMGQLGASRAPDANVADVGAAFDVVQRCIADGLITAGHDRSDGGLITTLLEMAFSGVRGFDVDVPALAVVDDVGDEVDGASKALFNEAPGLVLEVAAAVASEVLARFAAASCRATVIGASTADRRCKVRVAGASLLDESAVALWLEWEATSFALERRQRDARCVESEWKSLAGRKPPKYVVAFDASTYNAYVKQMLSVPRSQVTPPPHRVAVVRCEGSNGDREMAAAFTVAGLEAWDVTMKDLAHGRVTLDQFRGVAFVGGFSYADVMDSAKGWAATILYNGTLKPQFEAFRARPDTFSLGVCNGCQLLALLGWVAPAGATTETMPRFVHNASAKFESRWLSTTVLESPAVLLKDMAGSTLGVWVAHGEGRLHCPTPETAAKVFATGAANNLAPLRYADDDARPTDAYPFCPNGSLHGAAALCSADGRHLAMMPHPERCLATWHQPFQAHAIGQTSPWLRLFENARIWLDSDK